jgi:uncharacterized membrane protein YqhA
MASHKARKVVTAGNRLAGFAAVNSPMALQVAAGVAGHRPISIQCSKLTELSLGSHSPAATSWTSVPHRWIVARAATRPIAFAARVGQSPHRLTIESRGFAAVAIEPVSNSVDPANSADAAPVLPSSHPFVRRLFWTVRFTMIIGIGAMVAAAVTLLVFGAFETVRYIIILATPLGPDLTNREVYLASIKLIDAVLLATILQVVAMGIYALFIDGEAPLPRWMRTDDVDSLKNKLAGIIAVMLGVLFLEQVIEVGRDAELLPMGLAVAIVIWALSYFIRSHPSRE